jgi:hypothetical protein
MEVALVFVVNFRFIILPIPSRLILSLSRSLSCQFRWGAFIVSTESEVDICYVTSDLPHPHPHLPPPVPAVEWLSVLRSLKLN